MTLILGINVEDVKHLLVSTVSFPVLKQTNLFTSASFYTATSTFICGV